MIFFPLFYYLVWAFPRHRHPIEPVILLLFAYAVDQLYAMCAQSIVGRRTPS